MSKKKVIIIGTEPWSLVHFRGHLIESLKNNNCDVITVSKKINEGMLSESLGEEFSKKKIKHIPISFKRGSISSITDIKCFFNLYHLMVRERPDLVLAYTIKPVIWGGLAARLARAKFYGLITGLGFTFQGKSFTRKVITFVSKFLYREALRRATFVFFQNLENMNFFISNGITKRSNSGVVNGSGVDLDYFAYAPISKLSRKITFLCVARLLGEKGLREYARAAKIVSRVRPGSKFQLLGPEDVSPDAIKIEEINSWSNGNFLEYLGETEDVRPFIKQSSVFVLPSYHEGLPRSVIEAMAMGRPIITTTAPGCKETVDNNVNGFKVPVADTKSLAEKMIWFIDNRQKIIDMGVESRRMAERLFDVKKINQDIIDTLDL